MYAVLVSWVHFATFIWPAVVMPLSRVGAAQGTARGAYWYGGK